MGPMNHESQLRGPDAERRSWRFKAILCRHASTLLLSVSSGFLAMIPVALAANWLMPKSGILQNELTGIIGFLIGFLPVIVAQGWLHRKEHLYRSLIISASLLVALSTVLLGWSVYKNMTYVPRGPFDGIQYVLLGALAACGGGVALMLFAAAALGGRSRRMLAQLPSRDILSEHST